MKKNAFSRHIKSKALIFPSKRLHICAVWLNNSECHIGFHIVSLFQQGNIKSYIYKEKNFDCRRRITWMSSYRLISNLFQDSHQFGIIDRFGTSKNHLILSPCFRKMFSTFVVCFIIFKIIFGSKIFRFSMRSTNQRTIQFILTFRTRTPKLEIIVIFFKCPLKRHNNWLFVFLLFRVRDAKNKNCSQIRPKTSPESKEPFQAVGRVHQQCKGSQPAWALWSSDSRAA